MHASWHSHALVLFYTHAQFSPCSFNYVLSPYLSRHLSMVSNVRITVPTKSLRHFHLSLALIAHSSRLAGSSVLTATGKTLILSASQAGYRKRVCRGSRYRYGGVSSENIRAP